MDVTYKIRRLKDSNDKDLLTLLRLYNDNIAPAIKTNTNEILHWIDYYKDKQGEDTFIILALYINDKPIGFCQVKYLCENKILFIDYCVIDPDFRGRSFNEFTYLVRDYFAEEKLEINYFLTEIVYFNQEQNPSNTSSRLIRLLKMAGFRVIKAPYKQPELGINNHESEMNATLMLYINGGVNDCRTIKKETYLDMVYAILYKHYITWYEPFMTSQEKNIYKRKIDNIYNDIQSQIQADVKSLIILNGEPYNIENTKIPAQKNSNVKIILTAALSFLISFLLISILGRFIENRFQISADTQANNMIISGVVSIIMVLICVCSNRDMKSTIDSWIRKQTK